MNQPISKGMAALLIVLLALQAPVALAFACADHGSKAIQASVLEASVSEVPAAQAPAVKMPTMGMSEADCHGKMQHHEASDTVAQSTKGDCCDDCSCPVATAVGITSTSAQLAVTPAPSLIACHCLSVSSLHPDRILHPPIS